MKTESRYSQCSYNALATVLNHFYGQHVVEDDTWLMENGKPKKAKDGFFLNSLPAEYKGYYGWIPYAQYFIGDMTENKKQWNGQSIDIDCETFSVDGGEITFAGISNTNIGPLNVYDVKFGDGELESITKGLSEKLEEGPCLLWIPWAVHWGNVWKTENGYRTGAMPNVTHAIVLESYDTEKNVFRISDNAVPNGNFDVAPEDLITKLLAMPELQKERDKRGVTLKGVEETKYHTRVKRKRD